jgi:two-component system sensor histidine kinase/response regulator
MTLPPDDDSAAERAALHARVTALEAEVQALREEARLARAVIAEAPVVVYAKSRDLRFVLSNRRHADLIGLPEQAILHRTDRELFHDDAAAIDATSARVLATGEPASIEFALTLEGAQRSFLETIFRLHDERGEVVGVGGIAVDITERRAAEAERRLLSLAVAQSCEAVVVTDLAGRIEFVNEAFIERTGYAREELIGQNPRILQSGRTPRDTYASLWQSLARGDTWRGQFVNRRKDGREFIERDTISPVREDDGRVTHYMAIKQDVTELERLNAELARYRAHLEDLVRQRTDEIKAVFRALPDLYFRVDRGGVVLDFVSGDERDLLVPPQEFLGRPLHDFLPPEPHARFRDALTRVFAGEGVATMEYDLTVHDGEHRYEARVLALGADQAVVVVRDITARRRAEQATAAARDAAEEASRVKTDFLARMSHEIRTPIASVVGYADLLLHGEGAVPETVEHAGSIRRNAEYLLSLLDDILDVSRIEAGRLTFTREAVDVAAMLSAVDSLLRPLAVERGLRLSVEIGPGTPRRVTADPLRLQQVLVNLGNNALKFTDRGGVTLRASFEATAPTPWLVVAVRDTGIGIAREQLPRLFTAFTQVHGRGVARGRGTGLGLAISARLAAGLGGRLDVESALGVGSTFTLRLPVTALEADDRPATSRAPSAAEPASLPAFSTPRHILVVDDNPDLHRLLERMLERLGATSRIAVNGQEALDQVAAAEAAGHPFDAVLMDMQMPVLDGYDAVRALRARGARVPVIALTAFAMSGDAERCLAAGCDAYLQKPINFARLRAALSEVLQRA